MSALKDGIIAALVLALVAGETSNRQRNKNTHLNSRRSLIVIYNEKLIGARCNVSAILSCTTTMQYAPKTGGPGPAQDPALQCGHNRVHYNMSSTLTTGPGLAVGLVTLQYVCPSSHYDLPPHADPFPYPPSRQYNTYALVDFQDNEDNVQDDDEDNEDNNSRKGDDNATTGRGQ